MKLIKLSDTHYIVVDDSEINEGDWCLKWSGGKWNICFMDRFNFKLQKELWNETVYKKITHSTQPESLGTNWMQSVKPLLLSEVEEAIYGYSVEKMAEENLSWFKLENCSNIVVSEMIVSSFKAGFKAHQELVKDKLFTIEDMINAHYIGWIDREESTKISYPKARDNFKQSKFPKTEWECTINNGKIELV